MEKGKRDERRDLRGRVQEEKGDRILGIEKMKWG